MFLKGNIMEVIFVHLNVRIHSLIHSAFSGAPALRKPSKHGARYVQDSEMNGMLHFLNELTLITADGKATAKPAPRRAGVEGRVRTRGRQWGHRHGKVTTEMTHRE